MCLVHVAQGVVCGFFVFEYPAVALGWMGFSAIYQYFGWEVKADTPMRDWRDYIIGFGAGLMLRTITNAL